jgi:hypothetical protein
MESKFRSALRAALERRADPIAGAMSSRCTVGEKSRQAECGWPPTSVARIITRGARGRLTTGHSAEPVAPQRLVAALCRSDPVHQGVASG